MRRSFLAAMMICWAASVAAAQGLPAPLQRPFDTLLPWPPADGDWEIAAGLLHRSGVQPPFFAEDRSTLRDEWRLSPVDVALGLGGRGEAQLQFGLQRVEEEGGLREAGAQDARLAFTWQVPFKRIDAALRFAVKLPNASDRRRLGTDETDVFLLGAAGRHGARGGWAGNLGLGILGSPREAGVQDDVVVLGAAAWLEMGRDARAGARPTLLAEVTGMAASRFGNDFRLARAGIRLPGPLPVDISLRRGLTSESEDWGLEAGLTLLHSSRRGR